LWSEGARYRYKAQGTSLTNKTLSRFMSQELENRFENFARSGRDFCRKIKCDVINVEYIREVIRASGSVAANYTEASDDIGKADEKMKIRISRREAKECAIFLRLIIVDGDKGLELEHAALIQETVEIRNILSAVLRELG
jgi:four helix bundle protein